MDRVTFAATGALEGNTLSGIAHVFGQRTLVGGRYIEFKPGAFSKALKNADVRAFWNHDTTLLLGRQGAGTVRVEAKPDGLHYAIDLPDTTYAADLKALVARGDLTEMSFGIMPGAVTMGKAEDGRPVQIHTSVESLFDISPVSMPAFGGTSIQLHSQRSPMNLSETLAAMEALTSAGETMSEEDLATFKQYEADVARFNESESARQRMADLKRPANLGFPAVIRPTPKGDAALDFAFAQYLRTGQTNHDIAQLYAQTEGSPSGGGYTVPTGFLSRLTERRVAFGGLLNAAQQLNTSDGRPLEWASIDDTSSSRADVVAEGAATAVGADLTFGTVTLGAYRYAAAGASNLPLKVSVELLQDSAFDVGAFVARALGTRIARKQAKDVIQGSGSGEPLGIMYGTAGTIEADVLSGTTAQNVAALNNLVHALDPSYRQGASWIFNDTTAAAIEGMLDAAGRPILINALSGIESGISRPTLFGYPVIIDQAAHNMDTNDVIGIAFGNWAEAYLVRHVKDVQVLVNPYAATGYIVYDAWARMDGKPVNSWAYVTGEGV